MSILPDVTDSWQTILGSYSVMYYYEPHDDLDCGSAMQHVWRHGGTFRQFHERCNLNAEGCINVDDHS